jgi:RimJ/RimL family protein N-acetyltransferase
MDVLPLIDGPRVRLRSLRGSDAPALFALHGDPTVMRYWSTTAWLSIDDAYEHLRHAASVQADGAYPWAIASTDSDELIGSVSLFNISQTHRRGELGYSLASTHWGQGLAGEAIRLALAYVFDVLELERVEADTDPRNLGSRRLLERLGFVLEGTMRRRWFVADEWCDTSWYGLLHEEFVRETH